MLNPYQSPNNPSEAAPRLTTAALAKRAGAWLCVAGSAHLLLMNTLPASAPSKAIDWSATAIVLLGIAVYFELRIAEIITRLIGSLLLIGCILSTILVFVELPGNGTLSYGRYSTDSPHRWQIALVILGMAATFGPPWYLLQIKLRPELKEVENDKIVP